MSDMGNPITVDIEAIKQEWADIPQYTHKDGNLRKYLEVECALTTIAFHVPDLIAEVERLRALNKSGAQGQAQRDEKIKELIQQNQQLREALEKAFTLFMSQNEDGQWFYGNIKEKEFCDNARIVLLKSIESEQ